LKAESEWYEIAVVGGGAAGMLSAAIAARCGARVLLIERNDRLGMKLRLTGKGRCNLTNDCSTSEAIENIPTGGRFLQSALSGFSPRDTIDLFASLGVPLKTERGNRVFPQSDKASDIADALISFAEREGASVRRCRAQRLQIKDGRLAGVMTSSGAVGCKAVILATGGMSYPATGSTGDGYIMARDVGHEITTLRASLVPLLADPDTCARMQGLTLKNIRLSIHDGGSKPVFEDFGELLFTHFGLSGPLTLSASAHMRDYKNKKYYATIDLKPALDENKLDKRILRDFEKYSNRDFINSLGDLLSKLMIPVIVDRSGIPRDTKVHSITREQRLRLVRLIKEFHIDINGPGNIDEAIITAGGVKCSGINPKTMESKLLSGLFFAGEIIDADAYTGGYNLQIAWSTAYSAALGALEYVKT